MRLRIILLVLSIALLTACGSNGSSGSRPTISRPSSTTNAGEAPTAETSAPETSPPRTDRPTNPPRTDRPTNPPRTSPPTNPPATNPPSTNTPATNPPATNPPATNPPTTNVIVVVPPPAITTTVPPSSSNAAPAPESSSSSSNTWVWILVVVAVLAIALGAFFWWRRRQQHARATAQWRTELATTVAAAKVARDRLHAEVGAPIAADRLESLRYEVESVAAALTASSASAPDETARTRTDATAKALRDYMLAIDSEQLLRTQSPAATEDALADANVTRRARGDEVDRSLTDLDALDQGVPPPSSESPPTSSGPA